MVTPNIKWGDVNGQQDYVLTLTQGGRTTQAEVCMGEMLHAVRQESPDRYNWTTAALTLPGKSPADMEQFGANGEELEATVAYQDAMKRISTRWESTAGGKKGDSQGRDMTEE